ncbi:hypothetical protein D3C80_1248060 [compost metagenome]
MRFTIAGCFAARTPTTKKVAQTSYLASVSRIAGVNLGSGASSKVKATLLAWRGPLVMKAPGNCFSSFTHDMLSERLLFDDFEGFAAISCCLYSTCSSMLPTAAEYKVWSESNRQQAARAVSSILLIRFAFRKMQSPPRRNEMSVCCYYTQRVALHSLYNYFGET